MSSRLRGALGPLGLVGTIACTVWIVLDAASAKSPLVPHQPAIAGWLNGPGAALSYRTFLAALLAMTACYIAAVAGARRVSPRLLIGTIVALHVVLFAGPVLISQDVFQYIDYGRLGVIHGINPFSNGPISAPHDPLFHYVGTIWYHVASAYGPAFTLASYPIALLGVDGAIWGMKVLAIAASLAALTFVWLCAKRLGRDPVLATLIVGVNPLWVIYGVGGYHNDLLMDALMMAGVWLLLRGEDARGAAAVVAGAAVKATAIVVLPFVVLARAAVEPARRRRRRSRRVRSRLVRRLRRARTRLRLRAQAQLDVRLQRQLSARGRPPHRAPGRVPRRPHDRPRRQRGGRAVADVADVARVRLDLGVGVDAARARRQHHLAARVVSAVGVAAGGPVA